MSRGQRIGLLLAAVIVAVVAFVVVSPGGDDDDPRRSATPATETTEAERKTETETATEPAPEPAPAVERIAIVQGAVKGGARTISVSRGDTVRVVVSSDTPDELHLHGFDIEHEAAPGRPARFRFKANIEGSFEMESHTAEDAGRDPLVARVVVKPK